MFERPETIDQESFSFVMHQLCNKFNIITLKIKQVENEKIMAQETLINTQETDDNKLIQIRNKNDNLKTELQSLKQDVLNYMEDKGKSQKKAQIIWKLKKDMELVKQKQEKLDLEKKVASEQVEVLEIRNNYAKRDLDEIRGKRDEIAGLLEDLQNKKEEYEIKAITDEKYIEEMKHEKMDVENQVQEEIMKRSESVDVLRFRKAEYKKLLEKTILFDKKVKEIDKVLAKEGHVLLTKKDRLNVLEKQNNNLLRKLNGRNDMALQYRDLVQKNIQLQYAISEILKSCGAIDPEVLNAMGNNPHNQNLSSSCYKNNQQSANRQSNSKLRSANKNSKRSQGQSSSKQLGIANSNQKGSEEKLRNSGRLGDSGKNRKPKPRLNKPILSKNKSDLRSSHGMYEGDSQVSTPMKSSRILSRDATQKGFRNTGFTQTGFTNINEERSIMSHSQTNPTFYGNSGSVFKSAQVFNSTDKLSKFGTPNFDNNDHQHNHENIYNSNNNGIINEGLAIKKVGQVLSSQREYIEALKSVIFDRENQLTELKNVTVHIKK